MSLLQYMKDTRLDNPEICVRDRRIEKIDEVVQEVKQSEEWEAVKMNILEVGIQIGREEGIAHGEEMKLIDQVCKKLRKGKSLKVIAEELEEEPLSLQPIYEAAMKTAPQYDINQTYEILKNV